MNPYAIDNADYQTALTRYATPARQYKNAAQDYNLALNAYKDAAGTYNTQAADYNSSFYKNPSSGNNFAYTGQGRNPWAGVDPTGYALYSTNGQQVLRKPTSVVEETAQYSRNGKMGATITLPNGNVIDPWWNTNALAAAGYVGAPLPFDMSTNTNHSGPLNFTVQRPVFTDMPTQPAEFTQTRPTQPTAPVAPEGTLKQMQNRSSAAEMLAANERGLIGNVLAGRGAL